ncbi:uncharacterized protein BX663DRAFT_511623 [Cokeromyces recurvatus]|uniref:uncharacterized protein n=1 Tax=Cokeromyces recurvatus TaxID=90255 RepID=UPI0022206E67|nr:uncharacterized protein BX663DRAFT_511623 [Cokeromyces recurvatus]KAI7902058.1 hypothetical protein BX663DRAFT_511623 [Cokeromyces recurvatus]
MSTLIIDKDFNDDIIHLNEEPLYAYSSPFTIDELYPQQKSLFNDNTKNLFDNSSEEEFHPQAPPPSPQSKPMLDMIFTSKLNENETLFPFEQHAQALDKLLRKTLKKNRNGSIIKSSKRQRSSCLRILPVNNQETSLLSPSWKTRTKSQKMDFIIKATENTKKLKSVIILDDKEEEKIINELKDMGL